MPVWVGQIAAPMHWPSWAGGALATLQLACLTLSNLTGPVTIGTLSPRTLCTWAALAVAAGFLLMAVSVPFTVIAGAILSGIGCGWLLSSINSVAACSGYPQRTFALLQLVLVMLAVALFFSLPRLLAARGVAAVFAALGACAMAAVPLLRRLPVQAPASRDPSLRRTGRGSNGKAIAVLFALGIVIASQTALMASIMEVGGTIGLGVPAVGTLMSAAAILCLVSPLGARLLGDRMGLLLPLVTSTLVLALTATFVTRVSSTVVFFGLMTAVMGLPLFIFPYALAALAKFGGAGRWAAVGPGFMMAGAAVGPSLAGFARTITPLKGLGECMAFAIVAAATVFALSRNRIEPQSDDGSPR
jgi:hypothetical protein